MSDDLKVYPVAGWAIETGFGWNGDRWACVRNLESQCGQDFYEDRDPLIFHFLSSLANAEEAEKRLRAEAKGK